MTGNIRILLAQIATFEAQHKAGLTPPVTALAEFFDTARLAKLDVETFDRGVALPNERPAPPVTTPAPTPLERYDDEMVQFVSRMPLALLTRAVTAKLEGTGAFEAKRIVIGGDRGQSDSRPFGKVHGPCGA